MLYGSPSLGSHHYAMALRFLMIAAAIILLAAIAMCALSPSSYMTQIPFIPTWLGTWALLSNLPDLRGIADDSHLELPVSGQAA